MPKVFISYRHLEPDASCAQQLSTFLEQNGYQVFIDQRILVGQKWVEEIARHLRTSQHFIVLLSADSIRSDMLRQEVADAHVLSCDGSIRVYPVRLAYEEPLPYDLGSYLNPLQYVLWKRDDPWTPVCGRLLDALRSQTPVDVVLDVDSDDSRDVDGLALEMRRSGAPLPAADPRLDTGAVQMDSPFYVQRAHDDEVKRLVPSPGTTVLIKGPRQVGKTSLLTRSKGAAERNGHQTIYVDFQLIDTAHLDSLKSFALYLAHRIARSLRTSLTPAEVWDDYLGAPESLTDFIERAVLVGRAPVTVCFDEADRIFDYAYRNAFFAMVRAWHNRRASVPAWERFGLVIAHSTEPALFIDDLNQSPFNVGQVFRLSDFQDDEVAWLDRQHGSPIGSAAGLQDLRALVGGHPYLIRQTLYVLATRSVNSLGDLIASATDDGGPFGDHLRRHLFGLTKRPQAAAALAAVVHGQPCPNETDFQRLKAAGLVEGASRTEARVRCGLYQRYFARHL